METKKILFCATTPMNYAMLKTIHLRLKQDERIELWFTANHNAKKLYRSIGLENENIIVKYRSMLTYYDMRICPSFL